MQVVRRSAIQARWPRARGARLGVAGAAVLGLGLLGAAAFGLVHVVGGAMHGNERAVWFGVWLAGASCAGLGALGGAVLVVARRAGGGSAR